MKNSLRHFYFDRIFFITAKLTAIVDDTLHFPPDLVQASSFRAPLFANSHHSHEPCEATDDS